MNLTDFFLVISFNVPLRTFPKRSKWKKKAKSSGKKSLSPNFFAFTLILNIEITISPQIKHETLNFFRWNSQWIYACCILYICLINMCVNENRWGKTVRTVWSINLYWLIAIYSLLTSARTRFQHYAAQSYTLTQTHKFTHTSAWPIQLYMWTWNTHLSLRYGSLWHSRCYFSLGSIRWTYTHSHFHTQHKHTYTLTSGQADTERERERKRIRLN